jgi:hypothetical protein
MEKESQVFWGLDASKIETIEDIRNILGAMDLYIREDLPDFDKVKHLFTKQQMVLEKQ